MLYGYGGFNVSLTPAFSIANAVWKDVYAVPSLRGGGEYGKNGMMQELKCKNKMYLMISLPRRIPNCSKYTSSDFLAIRGGSNGGLLVGATMTQRPELMKVALPAVG
jgi:prolyl oligopeptidase